MSGGTLAVLVMPQRLRALKGISEYSESPGDALAVPTGNKIIQCLPQRSRTLPRLIEQLSSFPCASQIVSACAVTRGEARLQLRMVVCSLLHTLACDQC